MRDLIWLSHAQMRRIEPDPALAPVRLLALERDDQGLDLWRQYCRSNGNLSPARRSEPKPYYTSGHD